MRGPCMCGDLYCGSCGPAQGNWRCEICGVWSGDGGCADPQKCAEAARAADEAYAEALREDARLAEEFQNDLAARNEIRCANCSMVKMDVYYRAVELGNEWCDPVCCELDSPPYPWIS